MKIKVHIIAALTLAGIFASCSLGQTTVSPTSIRHSGPNIPGPGEKVINVAPNYINLPVAIGRTFFDGQPIKPGQPFPAGDDWLKRIEVEIQNKSTKTLIEGSIRVDFGKLANPGVIIWMAEAGRIPEHQLYTHSGEKIHRVQTQPVISVPPGGTFRISMAPSYENLKTLLEHYTALSNVNACIIDPGGFYFSDETRWSPGSYFKEDPAHPGQYIRITRDEFSGTRVTH
jgi:hypothetical protein